MSFSKATALIKRGIILFSLLITLNLQAQNVTVTGASGISGSPFATLKAAFDQINATAQTGNNIIISIDGNTVENAAAVLNAGAWVSLRIQPGGGVARSISSTGTFTGGMIDLNGADSVIIDGLNSGGNSLTIENSNLATNDQAILLRNDAENNIIRNCTIKGSGKGAFSAATNLGGVVVFGAVGAANGNRNNVISNNNITASGSNLPYCGIGSYGSATLAGTINNTGNTISGNSIYDVFNLGGNCWGIFISNRSTDFSITNNSVFQTATRTSTGSAMFYGIYINNTTNGNNFTITGNYIGGSDSKGAGSAFTIAGANGNRFFGIRVNQGTTTVSSIQNNKIWNISLNSTSGVTTAPGIFCGIALEAGIANIGNVSADTVGSPTGTITVTGATSAAIFGIWASESSGSQSVANNVVTDLSATGSTATVGHIVCGIQIAGVGSTSVTSNTIKNLKSGTNGTTTATSGLTVYGIYSTSSGAPILKNNIISACYLYTSGSSLTTVINGISTSSGGNTTISGNTIYDLINASACTGTTTASSVIGILNGNASLNIIDSNLIYNLVNTNTGSGAYNILGIRTTAGTGSLSVSKNIIHSFKSSGTSTSTIHTGIQISGSAYKISNNMIRLGIDGTGASVNGDYTIKGIDASAGSPSVDYNSVYIGGASSGAVNKTYAIDCNNSSVVSAKNNIAVNMRTNATANTHVAIYYSGTLTASKLTNNLIYANTASGGALARNASLGYYTTLSSVLASGYNANGVSSDPQFISSTGTAPGGSAPNIDLHINTAVGTEIESGGTSLAGLTDDIDALAVRNATTPDIGADEGTFISADLTPPVLSFTPIADLTGISAPSALSVTVTDARAGVNTTAGTNPRLYFKRCSDANAIAGNTSADNGWKYVETSSSASPFSFTIDYSIIYGGSIASGSIIQYFIVAQDLASVPNVAISNNLSFASVPSSVNLTTANLPSGTIPVYIHQLTTGTFTLGTGGDFTSLSGTCGCFRVVNASSTTLSGDITLQTISDITEDNTNQLTTSGPGSAYKVIVQPSSATMRTISGTVADASLATSTSTLYQMLGINNGAKLYIDGRYSGSGKYLTFRNTFSTVNKTSAVIQVSGSTGATLDVKNAILEGNNQYGVATLSAAGIINVFTSGAACSISIDNCVFRDARGGTTGYAASGVYINSITSAVSITNNEFDNIICTPIQVYIAGTTSISNNHIYASGGNNTSSLFHGIITGTNGGGPYNISNNYIGGSTTNAGGSAYTANVVTNFKGIYIQGGANTVQGNIIQNINLTNSGAADFNGIEVNGSSSATITTGTGNTIGHPTNSALGITHAGSGLTNAINIGATTSGGNTISNNIISYINGTGTSTSVKLRGIITSFSQTGAQNITNNTIHDLSTNSTVLHTITTTTHDAVTRCALAGIISSGSSVPGNITISGNTIYNLTENNTTASTSVIGVEAAYGNNASTNTVSANKIFGLVNKSTSTSASIVGIRDYDKIWSFYNNMVTLDNGSNTNAIKVYGMMESGEASSTTTSTNYHYNTVTIGGSASSGASTTAAYCNIKDGSNTDNLRNNIFQNTRINTGTAACKNYAIELFITPGTLTEVNSNYNYLSSTDVSALCYGSSTDKTFATWKSIGATFDPNSISPATVVLFNNTPTGDLHLASAGSNSMLVAGTTVATTKDYDGTTRAATPTIGADEFNQVIRKVTGNFTGACQVISGSSWIDIIDSSGNLVFSINPNGNNLGNTCWAIRIIDSIARTDTTNLTGLGGYTSQFYKGFYLNRNLVITPTNQPASAVSVRFYYATYEFDSLKKAVQREFPGALNTKDSMFVTKYHPLTPGKTEDLDPANNHEDSVKANALLSISNTAFGSDWYMEFSTPSFSEFAPSFTPSSPQSPLPVRFISFKGRAEGNHALLEWVTASERNSDYFEVERSVDGYTWNAIGKVTAAGNSQNLKKYAFTDYNAASKTDDLFYYRLKQVDFDSKSAYSTVAIVNFKKDGTLHFNSLTPNPFSSELNLNYFSPSAAVLQIKVYDLQGKLTYSQNARVVNGTNQTRLSLKDLAPGYYFIQLTGDWFYKHQHSFNKAIKPKTHVMPACTIVLAGIGFLRI